jgi:plastocyanin
MRFRLLATTAAVAGSFALAACGGGGSSSSATIPADADLVVKAVGSIAWEKSEYTATAGENLVVLVNESTLPHNLHIVRSDGSQLPDTVTANTNGDIVPMTVALDAGTYTLICTVPGHTAMQATLTVS